MRLGRIYYIVTAFGYANNEMTSVKNHNTKGYKFAYVLVIIHMV